jgi:hypothetical protein
MQRTLVLALAAILFIAVGCSAGDSRSRAVNSDATKSLESPASESAGSPAYAGEKDESSAKYAFGGAGGDLGKPREIQIEPASQLVSPFDDRDVIRTATLEVRVEDIDEAERAANKIVAGLGGYVDSVSSTDLASANGSITLATKVPVRRFEESIQKFEDLGVRLSKSVQAQDVTKQLIDSQARIKNLLLEEEFTRNMLKNTRDINQIYQLRGKLNELRQTIEVLSGEQKNTKEQAALSTITVTLRQGAVPAVKNQDPNWFAQAYGEASANSFGVFKWATMLGLYAVMFSPIWGGALLVVWLVRRQSVRKAAVQ